jgi:perosamine synthetase
MNKIIPVSEPLMGKLEEKLVLDCLRTGWVSSEGKYVKEFEKACASYSGRKAGIATSGGSTALQVAVKCLPLSEGDEIIMPSFTIISCAIAIIEAGAVPVLVDSDPETWSMNVEEIEKKITPKTKAIMAVHIYGHPADMDPILKLAKIHNLYVIEDAAEAHGAEYKTQKCGGFGDISILSFYANKLITTGEGGMVLTDNPEFEKKARSLINLCFKPEARFLHTEIGHNYRLSNINSALGAAQLTQLEKFVTRKREMAQMYQEGLNDLPLQLPCEKEWAKNIYWMYGMVIDDSIDITANEFCHNFKNIFQTRPFFIGMHQQPVFHKMGLFINEKYPICERIAKKGFYIPSGQALTNEQINTVCKSIRNSFKKLVP